MIPTEARGVWRKAADPAEYFQSSALAVELARECEPTDGADNQTDDEQVPAGGRHRQPKTLTPPSYATRTSEVWLELLEGTLSW